MINYVIYIAVICTYMPGIYWIVSRNLIIKAPIISVFMLMSFIFIGVGSFYAIFPINITGASLISLPFVIMLFIQPMIFYILYLVPPFSQISSINWQSKIIKFPLSKHIRLIYFLWIASFIIIFYYLYNNGLPLGWSLENWFSSDSYLRGLRQDAAYNTPNFWVIKIGFYKLPLSASVYSFIVWMYFKRTKTLFVMCSSFLLTVILSFSFLYKEYLFLLVAFTMYASWIIKNKFQIRNIVYVVVTAFCLLGFFFFIYMPDLSIDLFLKLFIERIFSPYAVSMAFISKSMLESGNFFDGTTSINPLGILPFKQIRLDLFVHELLYSGLRGSVPVPFLAEGYANFSWLGIFAFWFLALFSLSVISYIASKIKDRISTIFFVMFVVSSIYKFPFCTIHEMINHLLIFEIILLYLFLNYRIGIRRPKVNLEGYHKTRSTSY